MGVASESWGWVGCLCLGKGVKLGRLAKRVDCEMEMEFKSTRWIRLVSPLDDWITVKLPGLQRVLTCLTPF
jgi:hypothetical protein